MSDTTTELVMQDYIATQLARSTKHYDAAVTEVANELTGTHDLRPEALDRLAKNDARLKFWTMINIMYAGDIRLDKPEKLAIENAMAFVRADLLRAHLDSPSTSAMHNANRTVRLTAFSALLAELEMATWRLNS